MIAKIINELCRLGDQYSHNYRLSDDPKKRDLIMAKKQALSDVDEIIQTAWNQGESMKTELFEVQPRTVEDVLILGIKGLRVFLDPADGQIFYELEGRHLDTEKEVIARVIESYNRGRSSETNAITGNAIDITYQAEALEWKRQKDGSYEKKPLPKIRRA